MALTREQQIAALEKDWAENPRWKGVTRTYTAADVVRLRGSVQPEHTFAKRAPKSCGTWSPKVPTRPSAQKKISSTAWAP
jgi:hypothetical protein